MTIKFGPSGLGGVKDAIKRLEEIKELELEACEIAFTYGVYIKKKEDAIEIGKAAKKLGITLSIHAQYWINLNSAEPEKIEKSKERLLQCLETGTWLGVRNVVFHPGFYGKMDRDKTYENIKKQMIGLEKERKKRGYTSLLAPETMGKINVFGSYQEINKLVKETGCSFCIDFAHILARDKNYQFEKVLKLFGKHKNFHIHFSGIEYGKKGEKHHLITPESELKKLIKNLPKSKNFVVINESPQPTKDSVKALKIYRR